MSEVERLFSIAGKTALVTGATAGIGRMIAETYVRAGAHVHVNSRKPDACAAVVEELSELGSCAAAPGDLSTQDGCAAVARDVAAGVDHLDILVNNAGAAWGATFDEFPDHAWSKVMDLNVRAAFNLTQALAPQLRAAAAATPPARVINIGSADGVRVPSYENYSYSASKAALHQLTRHLAKFLGPEAITVNAILPGVFPSRMMAATIDALGDEIVAMSPLGRIGEPDDIGSAAVYLASPGASWVTGSLLVVDGGVLVNS